MTYMYLIFFSVFFGKILITLRHIFLRDDGHQSRFAEHHRQVRISASDKESQTLTISILLGRWTGEHSSNFLLFSILLSTQCLVTLAGTPCLSIFFFSAEVVSWGKKKKEKEFSRPLVCFPPLHLFSLVICLLRWKPRVCKDKQELTTAWQKNPSCIF